MSAEFWQAEDFETETARRSVCLLQLFSQLLQLLVDSCSVQAARNLARTKHASAAAVPVDNELISALLSLDT